MSAISGMNISMKNNNRRTKREAFSTISGTSNKESTGVKTEAVSEQALAEIRLKIEKQKKKTRRKNILIIMITIAILPFCIWLFFSYFMSDLGRIGWNP